MLRPFCLLLCLQFAAFAEEEVAIDPENAGPDFAVQGEYDVQDGAKTSAQVIALGKGSFHAVFYAGGLPGAGWDGKTKSEIDGKSDDGKVSFGDPAKGWSAVIADGVMTARTDQAATLKLAHVVRESPTLGAKPPAGALVLFDGTNTDAWADGKMDARKLLMIGATTKQQFANFSLHLEFRLPFKPLARGQGRGNSGVYMYERYECQVLDSFGLKGENNECGGIYTIAKPLVNMCFPPLSWQTYDIDCVAAQFDAAGKKTKSALATIRHNGVLIHDQVALDHPTTSSPKHDEGPTGGIHLQNHGNPVFYRNIWVVEKP